MKLKVPYIPQRKGTCGSSSLQQVLAYYGVKLGLDEILKDIKKYKYGTFMPYLGLYAKRLGFMPKIVTYDVKVFDPTWFGLLVGQIIKKLETRSREMDVPHVYRSECKAFVRYLKAGGAIEFDFIKKGRIIKELERKRPVIVDVCSTILHRKERKNRVKDKYSDTSGEPMYHAVVVSGHEKGKFIIVDPSKKRGGIKQVDQDFLIMTAHAASNNMLILKKGEKKKVIL